MPLSAADILAGPILRRVERNLVAVWVALTKPASIHLEIFRGVGQSGSLGAPIPAQDPSLHPTDVSTLRVGERLHIAVAVWQPAAPASLDFGQIYSYDLKIQVAQESGVQGLKDLGLLQAGTIHANGMDHPNIALGYQTNFLPSFALPPSSLTDLKIIHGSCRETDAPGRDTFAQVDNLVRDHLSDAKQRPHMLFLTGDQIYADAVAIEQLAVLHKLTDDMIGKGVEQIEVQFPKTSTDPAETFAYPVDAEHFPAARRAHLVNDIGHFSATEPNQAIGLGEFAALYLTSWCNIGWNWNALSELQARKQRYLSYKEACGKLYKSFGRHAFPSQEMSAVKARIPFHPAWRLLADEYRGIDRYLTDADRDAAWGKEDAKDGSGFDLWQRFWQEPDFKKPPADPGQQPVPPTDPNWKKNNRLARALTPSWYAARKFLGFDMDPEFKADGSFDELKFRRDGVRTRIQRLQWAYEVLPQIRRMLANIPTYMIFDDHEITDDWNLTPRWMKETRASVFGRAIIRNGLSAYALFQAWGNNPLEYREGTTGRAILDQIAKLFESATTDHPGPDPNAAKALEEHFDLLPPNNARPRHLWHFRYDGPAFEILALDSRTWRGAEPEGNETIRSKFSEDATATLMTDQAMRMQVPEQPAAGINPDGVCLVIAAAPVLGFPPAESLVQPLLNLTDILKTEGSPPFVRLQKTFLVGRVKNDPEPWGFVPWLLESLLDRLASRRRVIFLSGDVHYSFSMKMAYWRLKPDQTPRSITRFAQLTSSSFHKERSLEPGIFSIDFLQQFAGLASGLRRYGWLRPIAGSAQDRPPLEPGASSFSPHLQQMLLEDPILISPDGVPADAHYRRAPEWAWQMELVSDPRPDTIRLNDLHPPSFSTSSDQVEMVRSVGDRHLWQVQNGIPRRWLWRTNFTMVSFAADSNGRTNRVLHSAYTFDVQAINAEAKPYMIVEIPLDVTEPSPVERLEPVS